MALHEIYHSEHLPFMAFKMKKIPAKYRSTIEHLSGYAALRDNCAHEVFTELNTKNAVSKLTEEEKELFKFLGGDL